VVSGLGALVAHPAFWVLLVHGWIAGALRVPSTIVFLSLWAIGFFGILHIPYVPFVSQVALLDVALVLIIFKGDVRLR
jgi:hypothetical protein